MAAALIAASLVACVMRTAAPEPAPPALVVLPRAAAVKAVPGVPVIRAEVAADPVRRSVGLGGRASLGADEGMLFVYPSDQPRLFWMKDCLIALDIAFLDRAGYVLNVATLPPGAGLEGDEVPRAESEGASRYVLETSAGWFARNGVGRASRVDLRAALAGVVAR
jgi:uncharacterized membrane protein (UPF0127 family)